MAVKADLDAAVRQRISDNAEHRRSMRAMKEHQKELEERIADLKRQLDFATAIDALDLEPPKWLAPVKKGSHAATPMAMLTDPHFGEVVRPEEVEYLNAYNERIATMRLKEFGQKTVRLARDYTSGFNADGIVLMLGGDLFSGDIHDELQQTNEAPLYESVYHFLEPMAALITLFADTFGKCHIAATWGNHGRKTRKPQAKHRAKTNIEWLAVRFLEREFRADKRVTWTISDGADTRFSVFGTDYVLTHGDQFRGGSGISGALAPLMLGQHRKVRRAMASGKPFDWLVIGHWHQYLTLPGLIVGGTMKGLDEYAYIGNYGFEPAQQAFWITSPEHGPILNAPILVVDREAEGW